MLAFPQQLRQQNLQVNPSRRRLERVAQFEDRLMIQLAVGVLPRQGAARQLQLANFAALMPTALAVEPPKRGV